MGVHRDTSKRCTLSKNSNIGIGNGIVTYYLLIREASEVTKIQDMDIDLGLSYFSITVIKHCVPGNL